MGFQKALKVESQLLFTNVCSKLPHQQAFYIGTSSDSYGSIVELYLVYALIKGKLWPHPSRNKPWLFKLLHWIIRRGFAIFLNFHKLGKEHLNCSLLRINCSTGMLSFGLKSVGRTLQQVERKQVPWQEAGCGCNAGVLLCPVHHPHSGCSCRLRQTRQLFCHPWNPGQKVRGKKKKSCSSPLQANLVIKAYVFSSRKILAAKINCLQKR